MTTTRMARPTGTTVWIPARPGAVAPPPRRSFERGDVSPHSPPVALSTASVYPESIEVGFLLAAELGYDGVELMVWTDPVSQDIGAVERLSARYRVPVLAVHAPCLAVT